MLFCYSGEKFTQDDSVLFCYSVVRSSYRMTVCNFVIVVRIHTG